MIIRYDANMVKEHQFEYEPAIERRAACNYVGLKVLPPLLILVVLVQLLN